MKRIQIDINFVFRRECFRGMFSEVDGVMERMELDFIRSGEDSNDVVSIHMKRHEVSIQNILALSMRPSTRNAPVHSQKMSPRKW